MTARTPHTEQGLVPSDSLAERCDRDELHDWLKPRIPAILRRSPSISSVERQRCRYASSYDADIVTVHFDVGSEFKLFLKDFGCTRFPKNDAARRRERERRAYEEILAGAALGTPECYGSIWDDSRGRFWLLLEFVNGPELRAVPFEYWIMAAAWLGRLHGRFAHQADALGACRFLVRHDADFFFASADRALRDVAHISASLAQRLAAVLNSFDALVAVMTRQPNTLVHGHYRPCNIIVDRTANPVRICPVDWEQVALGSGFYDLAFITDGFEPSRLTCLVEAYRQQALDHHLAVPEAEEISSIVDCFRLFNAVNLLSRARQRALSSEHVARTVALIESLNQLVAPKKRGN